MRNWNKKQAPEGGVLWSCCEPTYKELKRNCEKDKIPAVIVLRAYLWGIETIRTWNISGNSFMLRAYLWGIETLINNLGYLTHLPLLRAYLWGIETEFIESIRIIFSCCEPTYEELKPSNGWIASMISSKLRAYLWGIETLSKKLKNFLRRKLRAYLWGIETSVFCGYSHFLNRLRAYLWGIETK